MKRSTYKLLLHYAEKHLFTWACTALIIILSLYPFGKIELPVDVPLMDKWVHFVMYGTLSLIFWAEHLMKHGSPKVWRLLIGGFVLPMLTGGLMELGQAYLTTTRAGDWWDFVANCVGVVLACAIGCGFLLFQKTTLR